MNVTIILNDFVRMSEIRDGSVYMFWEKPRPYEDDYGMVKCRAFIKNGNDTMNYLGWVKREQKAFDDFCTMAYKELKGE